jgi:V/A-type H+-transporting ATPase subunit C
MYGFEYGNTRLRAMKSRLLSKETLESHAISDNVDSLITGLTKTPYRKAVETALARTSGVAVIDEALSLDFGETVGKIQQFYEGTAGESVAQLLRIYDVQNLKAVLRGLSQHLSSDEILGAILPVGEIPGSIWILFARADGPREAIDLLTTLSQPLAQPLLELRAKRPGATIADMELALEHWYFNQAHEYLTSMAQAHNGLGAALKLKADLNNLSTVLRFAFAPAERKRLAADGLHNLLVGPGEITFQVLESAGEQNSLEETISILADTPYATALQLGYQSFRETGRLSDFELQLRLYRLQWMRKQIRLDPLGIGVPVGYIALKENEISNLRWIAHAIRQGFDQRVILAGLEF